MERLNAIVLESNENSCVVEIFASDGMRYSCFSPYAFKRTLSKGLIANFSIIPGKTLPVIGEVVVKAYPKMACIEDLQLVHGFLKNCSSLIQVGSCEPEVFKIVADFIGFYSEIDELASKKIFFRTCIASILLQIGFLNEEVVENMGNWKNCLDDWLNRRENNFQRGFTIEKFDAKITLSEVLSYASKEFNLNLYVV